MMPCFSFISDHRLRKLLRKIRTAFKEIDPQLVRFWQSVTSLMVYVPKSNHSLCLSYVKDLDEKILKIYMIFIISGQYSGVVQLFENISSDLSPWQNTKWPRIVGTPSHAVVIEYAKLW